jgi:hypothetical protein
MGKAHPLIGLAVLVLLVAPSGCSKQENLEDSAIDYSDRMQTAIREVIPDQDRADRLAGLQAVATEEMKTYFRYFAFAQDDARRANADYDIAPEAFERITDSMSSDRRRAMETVIRVAMRLRSEMTPEEWARLDEEMR